MSLFNHLFLHCGCCYVEVQFFWRHEHTSLLRYVKERGPLFSVGSRDDSGVGIVIGQIWAPPWHPSRHIRQDACRLWRWVYERVGEHYLVATIITALRLESRKFHEIYHVRSVPYHTLGWVLYVKVSLFAMDSALEHPISYRQHYISSHLVVFDSHVPFLQVGRPHVGHLITRVTIPIPEVIARSAIALVHDKRPAHTNQC
jgi:hypothetical protein